MLRLNAFKQVLMLGLLSAVLGIFAIVVIGSLQILEDDLRRDVVGIISGVSLISMLASPLLIIVRNSDKFPTLPYHQLPQA